MFSKIQDAAYAHSLPAAKTGIALLYSLGDKFELTINWVQNTKCCLSTTAT
jgi:hypothetical protein